MESMYVVHGYWNTADADGVVIIQITSNERKALEALAQIAEDKAEEYAVFPNGVDVVEHTERIYEIRDVWAEECYAKFYVTKQYVNRI